MQRYVARVATTPADTTSAAAAEAKDLSRGLIGAGIAVCAWSTGTILAKYIDMGSLAIGFYRFAFFALALIVWMRFRGTPFRARVIRDSMWGGLALGADIALFFSAVKLTSIVNATIIGSMQPIVVGVIAARFFGERIGVRNIVWSAVAMWVLVLEALRRSAGLKPDKGTLTSEDLFGDLIGDAEEEEVVQFALIRKNGASVLALNLHLAAARQAQTRQLRDLFFDVVRGRVQKYRHWCTPVYTAGV